MKEQILDFIIMAFESSEWQYKIFECSFAQLKKIIEGNDDFTDFTHYYEQEDDEIEEYGIRGYFNYNHQRFDFSVSIEADVLSIENC